MEDASLRPQKRELPEEVEVGEAPPTKKRKGAKGPNPLSMKKKKVKEPAPRKKEASVKSPQPGSDEDTAEAAEIFTGVEHEDYSDDSENEQEKSQQDTPGVIDGPRKSRRRKRRK